MFTVRNATLFVFAICISLVATNCNRSISKDKAGQIAASRLKEYCKQEGLVIARFSKPEISSDEKHPWIFDYTSNTSPRHLIRIYIDRYGNAEIHRMIEGRS